MSDNASSIAIDLSKQLAQHNSSIKPSSSHLLYPTICPPSPVIMKFTLATALAVLAIPMAATAVAIPEALDLDPAAAHLGARSPADCTIHMKWTDNWGEAGFRRYRVHAWAEQGKLSANTSTMLQMWCATFFGKSHRCD